MTYVIDHDKCQMKVYVNKWDEHAKWLCGNDKDPNKDESKIPCANACDYDNACDYGWSEEPESDYEFWHTIFEETCVDCGECMKACPYDAITKE